MSATFDEPLRRVLGDHRVTFALRTAAGALGPGRGRRTTPATRTATLTPAAALAAGARYTATVAGVEDAGGQPARRSRAPGRSRLRRASPVPIRARRRAASPTTGRLGSVRRGRAKAPAPSAGSATVAAPRVQAGRAHARCRARRRDAARHLPERRAALPRHAAAARRSPDAATRTLPRGGKTRRFALG